MREVLEKPGRIVVVEVSERTVDAEILSPGEAIVVLVTAPPITV